MADVIDRLREQLKLAGKVRGNKIPVYRELPDGKKVLIRYDKELIRVCCSDVVELCELAKANGAGGDPIVLGQYKGHTHGMLPGYTGFAAMYADDLYHLIDLAKPLFVDRIILPSEL